MGPTPRWIQFLGVGFSMFFPLELLVVWFCLWRFLSSSSGFFLALVGFCRGSAVSAVSAVFVLFVFRHCVLFALRLSLKVVSARLVAASITTTTTATATTSMTTTTTTSKYIDYTTVLGLSCLILILLFRDISKQSSFGFSAPLELSLFVLVLPFLFTAVMLRGRTCNFKNFETLNC